MSSRLRGPVHPPDPRHRLILTALLLLVPIVVGLAVAVVGERSLAGAALLWAEPLLICLALYGVLAQLSDGHRMEGLALLLGCSLGTLALHLPAEPLPVTDVEADWSARLRDCANLLERPRASVRILSWTLGGEAISPSDGASLLRARPDVIVLNGLVQAETADRLAARLSGESKLLPGRNGAPATALIVRGAFQYCGGREDIWEMPLPAHEGGAARVVLSFPEVEQVGVLPLLALQLDRPGPAASWTGWPRRLLLGARHVAALARGPGPGRVVAVGDFGVPASFRQVAGHLAGASLEEVEVPATWPAQVGPLPLPGLHALDRSWHGEAWTPLDAQVLTLAAHRRSALLVELAPR